MNPSIEAVCSTFQARMDALGAHRVLVAFSGGMDSTVLLHLVRFASGLPRGEVFAAHFDHAMRPSSEADARWVSGVCRAWEVPLRSTRADRAPGSEAEARDARYGFLEAARLDVGADAVLTAHHADDQAETVLFRLLRGSGTHGLQGIPARRSPAVARPLLDVWRSDLEAYASAALLGWRDDPTNRDPAFARNALRGRILPVAERLVAPGARRSLVRLAEMAGEEEAAWDSVLPGLMRPLEPEVESSGITFRRAPFLELHPAVRMRVLRALASSIGGGLDRATAERAVAFAATAQSGRAIDLAGSLTLGVELDRLVLARPPVPASERPVVIGDQGPGHGTAILGGSAVHVTWGVGQSDSLGEGQDFDSHAIRFPLVVRSRRPGDRIRVGAGTRKVKKVLLEGRIPLSKRDAVPLLVDAEGEVLWIPGLVRSERGAPSGSSRPLRIGIGRP